MLNIAVDYDETYTACPDLWFEFMCNARGLGHNAFICTYRDDRYDVDNTLRMLEKCGFEIVYTRGVAKKWWCQQFGPGEVDVWIDDKPEAILNNSNLSVDGLAQWREECKLAKGA